MNLTYARSGGFVEYISLPTVLLVVVACAAAALIEVAMVTDWSGGAARASAAASDSRASAGAATCRTCGVVESVRPVSQNGTQSFSTVTAGGPEGVALLLGVLTGNVKFSSPLAYETQVRMDDGSVRATREFRAPEWKSGDQVRVMRGRIEPMPGPTELQASQPEPQASQHTRIERTVPTHALCEAESDGKVLVAWKNGRHYCFRYGGGELLSAASPAG